MARDILFDSGLNAKQLLLLHCIANGMSKWEACKVAGYHYDKVTKSQKIATELLKRPEAQEYLSKIMELQQDKTKGIRDRLISDWTGRLNMNIADIVDIQNYESCVDEEREIYITRSNIKLVKPLHELPKYILDNIEAIDTSRGGLRITLSARARAEDNLAKYIDMYGSNTEVEDRELLVNDALGVDSDEES